jgi:hypothetical protein
MERCLSGRKERFAKSSYGLHCTVGSNPTLSARLINMVLPALPEAKNGARSAATIIIDLKPPIPGSPSPT